MSQLPNFAKVDFADTDIAYMNCHDFITASTDLPSHKRPTSNPSKIVAELKKKVPIWKHPLFGRVKAPAAVEK